MRTLAPLAAAVTSAVLGACVDPAAPGAGSGTHPANGAVVAAPHLGFRPFGIAVSRQGTVYATQLDNASLGVGSAETLSLSTSVAVGNSPTAVAFDPGGATAYVTNQLSSNVGVVDVASNRQVALVPVNGNTFNVIVAPDGGTVYVTTNTNQVHAISTSTRTVTGSLAVDIAPNALVFGSGDTLLYVSSALAGTVTEISLSGPMHIARGYIVGGTPQGLAISPDHGTLYVANEAGALDVVDLATGTVTTPVSLGAGAFGLALTPDGQQLYVTLPSVGAVDVVDRVSLTLLKTITTGGTPRRIAFSADGLTAAVTSEAGSVVFIR